VYYILHGIVYNDCTKEIKRKIAKAKRVMAGINTIGYGIASKSAKRPN